MEAQPRRWVHVWTIWAALALAAIFLTLLIFLISRPDKEPYRPGTGDPIAYWEVVQSANAHAKGTTDATGLCIIAGAILLGGTLTIVGSSKHRLIVLPLLLLSGVLCYLTVVFALFSGEDTITLYHIDTVEHTHYHYHLTGGDVSSLDMPYSLLLLYNCDTDDTNCYAQRVDIYGGGWHRFRDILLEYNEKSDQLEVWADGEMIYAVKPDE
jgi:hypothetical protein